MVKLSVKSLYAQRCFCLYDYAKYKQVALENIVVFKDGEILIRYRVKWENDNISPAVESSNFDYDLRRKVKADLTAKVPYIVKTSSAYKPHYDLYIPADILEMSSIEYEIQHNENGLATCVCRKCNIKSLYINVNETLVWTEQKLIDLNQKACSIINSLSAVYFPLRDMDEIERSYQEIRNLRKEYEAEEKALREYTLDDYYKSIKKDNKEEVK